MRISDWNSDLCSSDLQEDSDVDAQVTKQDAAECYRTYNNRGDFPVEFSDFGFSCLGRHSSQSNDGAEQGEQYAQPEWKIARSHSGRGAHRIAGGSQRESDAYGKSSEDSRVGKG